MSVGQRTFIEGEFLESLWESTPRRVAAVIAAMIAAKGWYTKYFNF